MNLLERFREAVFRLIMLSALTKAAATHPHTTPAASGAPRRYYMPINQSSLALAYTRYIVQKQSQVRLQK